MSDNDLLKQAIEIAKKEVLEKLAREEPWLFEQPAGLYHLSKTMPNGKKTFTVHIKNGFIEEVVIHTSDRLVYRRKDG